MSLNTYNNNVLSSSSDIGNPIGNPIITLSNTLNDNEIWLEGATVSRTTYSRLFAVYGTTYGNGDGSTTFVLPDFRNRAIWGADGFGYLAAGLPNVTGYLGIVQNSTLWGGGAFDVSKLSYGYTVGGSIFVYDGTAYFDASLSNSIYGSSSTVQPPAIKVRVKTRYI